MSSAMLHGLGDCTPELHCGCLGEVSDSAAPVMSDRDRPLMDAIAEALGCERREASFGVYCGTHMYRRLAECDTQADAIAAALAPLIEARVREARAEAWDEGYRLDWTGGVKHINPYREGADQ